MTKAEMQAFYERITKLMAINPKGFRQPSLKRGRQFVTWITVLALGAFDLTPEPPADTAPDSKKGKSYRRYKLRHAEPDPVGADFSAAVEQLTNWQRKRWARAGYPGLRKKDAEKVLPFAQMVRT